MTVLDASAVIALLRGEQGDDVVAAAIKGARMSTVNFAEVIGKVIDARSDVRAAQHLIVSAGVTLEPLTEGDALLAGALRSIEGGTKLSLGDRCCLALALIKGEPVLTADRAWMKLDLAVDVHLVR